MRNAAITARITNSWPLFFCSSMGGRKRQNNIFLPFRPIKNPGLTAGIFQFEAFLLFPDKLYCLTFIVIVNPYRVCARCVALHIKWYGGITGRQLNLALTNHSPFTIDDPDRYLAGLNQRDTQCAVTLARIRIDAYSRASATAITSYYACCG